VVSCSDDCTVRMWDVKTRKCVSVFEDMGPNTRTCAVTCDGRTIVTASGGRLKLVDIERPR